MEKIYVLNLSGLFPTSSYFETLGVYDCISKCVKAMDEFIDDFIAEIKIGCAEGFSDCKYHYNTMLVEGLISKQGIRDIVVSNTDNEYFQHYWIEELEINKGKYEQHDSN